MSRRFPKKLRNFRLWSGILIALLTILSFQNCAPAANSCTGDAKNCASDESKNSASTSSSSSNSVWGGGNGGLGSGIAGGSGGSISSGSSSGSSSSSSGGVGVGNGGSSGTGGTGDTGTSADKPLTISKQPAGVTVPETNPMQLQNGTNFELSVQTTGGKSPLTYQWYFVDKNGVGGKIQHTYATDFNFSESTKYYSYQGLYYVEVTDGTGRMVRSSRVAVNFTEPDVSCAKGKYFTFTNQTWDMFQFQNLLNSAKKQTVFFDELFDGPRGKFLVHSSFDTYNLLLNGGPAGVVSIDTSANVAYKGAMSTSCRTAIPRIHTPAKNPGWSSTMGSSNQYADGNNYKYTGKVSFTCHNKKFLFKEKTCKWTYTPPATSTTGSSR